MYYCCICKFLKELLSIVSFETWCKGKDFYFYLPNFFESFFSIYFFSEVLSERLQDIRLDLPTSSLGIYLSGFLNPSFIMSPPHLSRLRVQKYCCKTYNPNISPTFLQLFFTLLDCQWFTNALFLRSFGFHSFFCISPSLILNSQSSIINSQKAYLLKTTKRESISILTGSVFDSRLVCFIIMIDLLKNV